ncbi:MAG: hypothetical protein KGY99_00105 [Phycisphaerae bacterium]|nr:hypothetical protein [Phycisphaerae bacterium]
MTSFGTGIVLVGTLLFPPAGRVLLPAAGFVYWLSGDTETHVHDATAPEAGKVPPAEVVRPQQAPDALEAPPAEPRAPSATDPAAKPAPPTNEDADP